MPGAADFSSSAQITCPGQASAVEFAAQVRNAQLIVVGKVQAQGSDPKVTDRGWIDVVPEAFLKGNPSGAAIRFTTGLPDPCSNPGIRIGDGDRVLLLATGDGGTIAWPGSRNVFLLADGAAVSKDKGDTAGDTEKSLVDRIRQQTNQYAVPASSKNEGAGIDWMMTIVPVGAAIVGLMVVGLLLMRVWHRIDPS
jgi:hypothetical protein